MIIIPRRLRYPLLGIEPAPEHPKVLQSRTVGIFFGRSLTAQGKRLDDQRSSAAMIIRRNMDPALDEIADCDIFYC